MLKMDNWRKTIPNRREKAHSLRASGNIMPRPALHIRKSTVLRRIYAAVRWRNVRMCRALGSSGFPCQKWLNSQTCLPPEADASKRRRGSAPPRRKRRVTF